MPRVLNKRTDKIPPDAVLIDRSTKWGNPFKIGPDGSRDEVVRKYKFWLLSQPELVEEVKRELAGKNLVCWCVPKYCHGIVLFRIANEPEVKDAAD